MVCTFLGCEIDNRLFGQRLPLRNLIVALHHKLNYADVIQDEVIPMSTFPLSFESEDRVRAVAHALWLEEGQPDGRAEAHWLKALEIINAEAVETAAAPKRKAAAPAAPKKLAAAAAKKAAPRKRS
jgi:hypothetical protein